MQCGLAAHAPLLKHFLRTLPCAGAAGARAGAQPGAARGAGRDGRPVHRQRARRAAHLHPHGEHAPRGLRVCGRPAQGALPPRPAPWPRCPAVCEFWKRHGGHAPRRRQGRRGAAQGALSLCKATWPCVRYRQKAAGPRCAVTQRRMLSHPVATSARLGTVAGGCCKSSLPSYRGSPCSRRGATGRSPCIVEEPWRRRRRLHRGEPRRSRTGGATAAAKVLLRRSGSGQLIPRHVQGLLRHDGGNDLQEPTVIHAQSCCA